jgi:hypothetical protein
MAKNKKNGGAAARNKQKLNDFLWMNDVNKRIKYAGDASFNMGFAHCAILNLFVLHVVEHYGPKRCQRMVKEYQEYVRAHYMSKPGAEGEYQGLTIYEIAEMLKDEVGVDINPDTGFFKVDKPVFLGEETE